MAKKDLIEEKTEELITPIAQQYGCEVVDTEYVKEGSDWYLRAYIEKEGGVTVNDCADVSRAFNEILDREDYVEGQYIFEVSSPGLTRPLKKEKDYVRSVGKLIDIKLFKPVDKIKEFTGVLKAFDESKITLEFDDNETIDFERANLAMIRLAFVE